MNIIKQNPYRVLGLLANSSERELQKQIGIIKRFAEIGKSKSFDYDFDFIGDISRSVDDIHHAASKIEQAHNKMLYSLFWFIKNNKFDEIVLNNLKDENTGKAIEIWGKTLKEEISDKNYSSYHNLSTLYIASSMVNGQLELQSLQKGIELKGHFINSGSLISFSELVTGNVHAVDSTDTGKLFVDEIIEMLSPYINKSNGINTGDLIALFNSFPDGIQEYVSSKFTEIPLSNIENAIEKTSAKRKESLGDAEKYGEELYKSTKNDSMLLKSILGNDSVQYQMITNKLANEIMQCSIDYFNEFRDSDDLDPGDVAIRIARYAKSVGATGQTKQRLEENTVTIQEWVDDKPNREKQGVVKEDIAYIVSELQKFQNGSLSIENTNGLLLVCKPKLSNIKNELGTYNSYYLQISDAVASNALAVLIAIYNQRQEDVVNGGFTLDAFKNIAYSIASSMKKIESLDMSEDMQGRFNINKKTMDEMGAQMKAHTQNSSEGCYIATMVYGDYEHPKVLALRKYRDDILSASLFGRILIKAYYFVSPHAVSLLKNQKQANKAIRALLDFFTRHVK